MLYIKPKSTDAAFHFSVETYFMERPTLDEPIFMIWQADHCAMLGAYQVAEAEIDLRIAKASDIQIVRRPSGGGTIFTDMGTLLCSLILPDADTQSTREIKRETFAGPIVRALNKLHIPAKPEGRNDILVEGKKVSGLAQHTKRDRVCTHGSLLYDTNLNTLTDVLQVDDEKIRSKAIRSVRSRVTNLSAYLDPPVSTAEFWTLLEQNLAEEWDLREYILSEAELTEIDGIYQKKFGNPDWTFGNSPKFSFHNSKRFPGGKVEVFLDVVKGVVAACSICGDFLGTIPIRGLEQIFEKQHFQCDSIRPALADIDLRPYLGDITKDELLSCLFDS